MKQTTEERDAIIKGAVEAARQHTKELNAGPMKHTLRKRAQLEAKQSRSR
ncbi:hypothetical protein N9D61_02030 [Planktomarina sp.]|nr:hypothetical protein [Planktomarina sp.]